MESYGCTFVLLLRNEQFEIIKRTLDSLTRFRRFMDNRGKNVQILCMNAEGQSTALSQLRQYSEHQNFEVLTRSELNLPFEQDPYILPEICALLNSACKRVWGVISLIESGETLGNTDALETLASSIEAVSNDPNLLILSLDSNTSNLPTAALFNSIALQNGILITASDGFEIVCKKRLFSGFRYERLSNFASVHHVPWLIGAIAFEYQSDKYASGLHLLHKQWF